MVGISRNANLAIFQGIRVLYFLKFTLFHFSAARNKTELYTIPSIHPYRGHTTRDGPSCEFKSLSLALGKLVASCCKLDYWRRGHFDTQNVLLHVAALRVTRLRSFIEKRWESFIRKRKWWKDNKTARTERRGFLDS